MKKHGHEFVEKYAGPLAFGLERGLDESTLICYLQKFSDDDLLQKLVPRLSEQEMEEMFNLMHKLLKTHFSDEEYHALFLKD